MAASQIRKPGHSGIWRDMAPGCSVTIRSMSSVRWSMPRIGFSISGLVCVSPGYSFTFTCGLSRVYDEHEQGHKQASICQVVQLGGPQLQLSHSRPTAWAGCPSSSASQASAASPRPVPACCSAGALPRPPASRAQAERKLSAACRAHPEDPTRELTRHPASAKASANWVALVTGAQVSSDPCSRCMGGRLWPQCCPCTTCTAISCVQVEHLLAWGCSGPRLAAQRTSLGG